MLPSYPIMPWSSSDSFSNLLANSNTSKDVLTSNRRLLRIAASHFFEDIALQGGNFSPPMGAARCNAPCELQGLC
jgi:hypothetical protein